METFKHLASNIKLWGAVVASVVALYSGLAFFGIEVPRPAWAAEVRSVQKQVIELGVDVTEREAEHTRLRMYQNEREQNTYTHERKPVPDYLLKERAELEAKLDRIQNELKVLRDRLLK